MRALGSKVTEDGKGKGRKLPESALTVSPKFFEGTAPRLNANEPYRPVLAKWITSKAFFIRSG